MNNSGNGSTQNDAAAGSATEPGTTGVPPLPVSAVPAAQATAALSEAMDDIEALNAKLVQILFSLSPDRRKRVVKAHTGIEPQAVALAQMILGKPSLTPVGLDPQEMLDLVVYCNKLTAFANQVAALHKTAEDTLLVNRSQLYRDSLDTYAVGSSNARRDPSIQPYLEKFTAFMKLGPRKTRSGQPQVNGAARKTKAAKAARQAAGGNSAAPAQTGTATPTVPEGQVGTVPPINGK